MDRYEYKDIVKLIEKMSSGSSFVFGTVTAFNGDNRTIKAIIEPNGVETGWCRCLQGAYIDKVGIEIVLGRVTGNSTQQYIVVGVVE